MLRESGRDDGLSPNAPVFDRGGSIDGRVSDLGAT